MTEDSGCIRSGKSNLKGGSRSKNTGERSGSKELGLGGKVESSRVSASPEIKNYQGPRKRNRGPFVREDASGGGKTGYNNKRRGTLRQKKLEKFKAA